jgi:hypothetical protein
MEYMTEKLITFGGIAYPKFGQIVILAGGAGCFVGETLVKTKDGYKEIRDIEIGEYVYSFDEETGKKSWQKVDATFIYEDKKVIEIIFSDDSSVLCTENHLFFVDGDWVEAQDLEYIDDLDVVKIKRPKQVQTVYDISVEDNHTFFITENDLPVHNSGKGFVTSNLLGIEGKIIDVDRLKELALKTPGIIEKAKEYGVDLSKVNLKNPDEVSMLHTILSDRMGIVDKNQEFLFQSIMATSEEKRPNLIFDVTMKDIKKLHSIVNNAKLLNYKPENIHIVWVINDIEIAIEQNKKRARVVPEDILQMTHLGAAQTMLDIVKENDSLREKIDGDIVFAFNKAKVDSKIAQSANGGKYILDANYFYIKRKGKPAMSITDIGIEFLTKISEYTPKKETWHDILDNLNEK